MTALPRWLPYTLLGVALLGLIAAFVVTITDAGSGEWLRDRVGGSTLYQHGVLFARVVPFLMGTAAAVALLERERRARPHSRAGEPTVERHRPSEAIGHWVNAVGIGLALISAAWMLSWFSNPFSLEVTYALHFVGAGLSIAAVTHHLILQLAGGKAGLIPRRFSDLKAMTAELVSYTGVYRGLRGAFGIQLPLAIRRMSQGVLRALKLVPERPGKYLATERVISYPVWAVLLATVIISGLVKTANYAIEVPGGLLRVMTWLHDGSALFIVVFLVIHVAATVLVPRNWPLLRSMFTTRISRDYVEEHLPRWHEELQVEEAAAATEDDRRATPVA